MTHIKFVDELADGFAITGEVLGGLRGSHV